MAEYRALFEVLTVTPALRQLIASSASAQALEAYPQTGTGTLLKMAVAPLSKSMTSFEEYCVLGMPHER